VNSQLPGASPDTMASAVTTPLERSFGRIAGITEMTSSSNTGQSQITMQFDLDRNIDAAARDVQAAINAARGQLPANLPNNPGYRKNNPSDQPIVILALTSDIEERTKIYDVADSILNQKIAHSESRIRTAHTLGCRILRKSKTRLKNAGTWDSQMENRPYLCRYSSSRPPTSSTQLIESTACCLC